MIVNPKQAVDDGVITNVGDGQVQQNGIDIRIDRMYRVRGSAYLGIAKKLMPNFDEVHPRKNAETGEWVFDLSPEQSYVFDAVEVVDMPENLMALIVTRSTLNRCGIRVTSGVWDSGFRGTLGGFINTGSIPAFIERGSRIAQVVFYNADSASMYNGQYQDGNSQSVGK